MKINNQKHTKKLLQIFRIYHRVLSNKIVLKVLHHYCYKMSGIENLWRKLVLLCYSRSRSYDYSKVAFTISPRSSPGLYMHHIYDYNVKYVIIWRYVLVAWRFILGDRYNKEVPKNHLRYLFFQMKSLIIICCETEQIRHISFSPK